MRSEYWSRSTRLKLQLGVLVVALAGWQVAAARIDKALLLPTPWATVEAGWQSVASGDLVRAWLASVRLMGIGLGLALVAAILIGLSVGLAPQRLRLAVEPVIRLPYVVPTIAVLPLFIVWFGLGDVSKVAIIAYSSFFEAAHYTIMGVDHAKVLYLHVGKSFGANRRTRVGKILVPGSVPYIATGMRLGVGQAVVGVILAEFFTAAGGPESGLGAFIRAAGTRYRMDEVFVGLVALGLTALGLVRLMRWLEHRLFGLYALGPNQ